MSIPHPPLTLVAALMAMCATSLAHAAENSGIRLIYERMPTATTTDLKVTTPTGDSATSGSGDLDSHVRIGLQIRHFNDAQTVAMGLGWGMSYGQLTMPNPVGKIDHKYFEFQLEPMVSYAPIEQLSFEGGLGLGLGLTRGEMLISQGGSTSSEPSKVGVIYDAALKFRPVYRPVKNIEIFGQVAYTLLMQERLMYSVGNTNVSEVESYKGASIGAGIGVVF